MATKKQQQEPVYEDIDPTAPVPAQPQRKPNRMSGFDIIPYLDMTNPRSKITPEFLEAVMEIQTGVVSPKYIQKKQNLDYISHVHATETMNTVFRRDWDYQVIKYDILEDGSAIVHAKMDYWYYNLNGERQVRSFIEVGSHEAYRLKEKDTNIPLWDSSPTGETSYRLWSGMTAADRILSATSRTLLRCMLRAFNYGANLYKDEPNPPITANAVWGELIKLGNYLGIPYDDQVEALKNEGFTENNLLDKTHEAVELFYNLRKKLK